MEHEKTKMNNLDSIAKFGMEIIQGIYKLFVLFIIISMHKYTLSCVTQLINISVVFIIIPFIL